MTSSKETEQKISQLQMIEQSIQNFNLQKQQLQSTLMESESAIEELAGTDTSYKIIGNIMVKVEKDSLQKELEETKDNTTIRINAIEKQEDAMREKAKALQTEVMAEMKEGKKEESKEE